MCKATGRAWPGQTSYSIPAPMTVLHYQLHVLYSIVVSLLALLSFCPSYLSLGAAQLLPIAGLNGSTSASSSQLQTYIVHLRKPAHMVSASPSELEVWHRSFLPTPSLDSGEPRMVYSYGRAISGFAAKLTPEEVDAMAAKEGFLLAHPDEPLVFETSWVPYFLRLSTADSGLWNLTNFAKTIVVAVIDSGINPSHSSFVDTYIPSPPSKWKGRCDLRSPNKCNNKIIGARNFDSAGPGAEPLDNNGHGTFVASVVGSNIVPNANVNGLAEGSAAGISAGAHLAIYRADSASGLIASFDEAIRDGADVITVSVSLPEGRFYSNDLAIAALSAAESRLFVSCAAGNGGPHRSSVRNGAPWVLTVGASTIDRALRVFLDLGNGEKFTGESLERTGQVPTQQLNLVFPGDGSNMLRTCSAPLTGVTGMAVVCQSDPASISPQEQGENVRNSMGAAMILMNSQLNGSTLILEDNVLPTVAITHDDSQRILNYVRTAGGRATVTMRAEGTIYSVSPQPTVASISGRGPSRVNGGILKPDVIGPGVNIIGASSQSSNGFVMMSGTSVSAPMLASIGAMLKVTHPAWSPAAIRSAIMTTSNHLNNARAPIVDQTGGPAGAFAIGAGHVHPLRANDPGLVYDIQPEDYIRYLCGLPGYTQREVDAVARRSVDCASEGRISAEELNYPSIAVALSGVRKTVTRTVRNEGPGRSTYMAEVEGMLAEMGVEVNPDVLNFMEEGEEQSFTVTFSIANPMEFRGQVYEGQLKWVATTSLHVVRSPLVVTVP
ncbi:hypothetical protein Taro_027246 [Colocasia esculenta]|uniref:Uncharacterized protein n=1 Tax=Colocasia esculenta TaxID=4460 RepID=A0A843VE15_COLES|nr:hypothetical protein [Colocasia esculenta]